MRRAFLDDRFGASHFLKPVLDGDPDAFFANGDDPLSQRQWARENGLPKNADLSTILLAQIEAHRTEIFYCLDPVRYGNAFLKRLPGSVKKTIAWRAAPSATEPFDSYDLVINNFPSLLARYRQRGMRAAYFAPGHDPAMDSYGVGARPVDILFVGGFSRHHRRRADLLEHVAAARAGYSIRFHLDQSKLTRLAGSPLGLLPPLRALRLPSDIRAVARPPIFGRELYAALGQAKIVINGAIDMAGEDRGNMRCWEAMGCGAALLSDRGHYPEGMTEGTTIRTYGSAAEAGSILRELLTEDVERERLAHRGRAMIRSLYSKEHQWAAFRSLAG